MKIKYKVIVTVPAGFGSADAVISTEDTYEEAEKTIVNLLQEDDRNEYQIRKVYMKGK